MTELADLDTTPAGQGEPRFAESDGAWAGRFRVSPDERKRVDSSMSGAAAGRQRAGASGCSVVVQAEPAGEQLVLPVGLDLFDGVVEGVFVDYFEH